jgi:3-carboxy-cis,cis-muconate cycloisomerase
VTFPALLLATAGALAAVVDIAEGLEVDATRMRANLEATGGQIMAEAVMMALAPKLGRADAHHVLEQASRQAAAENRHLEDVLAEDSRVTQHLSTEEIARLFDPLAYQGMAQTFIDRLLAAAQPPRN